MIVLRTILWGATFFFFVTGFLHTFGISDFPSYGAILGTLMSTVGYPNMEWSIVRAIRHVK